MTEQSICGSYFRPWSPGSQEHPGFLCPEKESPVLDLSKKSNKPLSSASNHTTKINNSITKTKTPSSKQELFPTKHSMAEATKHLAVSNNGNEVGCFPHPYLLQQLQAYYNFHLMRSLPALHGQQVLNGNLLKWQKQLMCAATASEAFCNNNKAKGRTVSSPSGPLNIDTVSDPSLIQRRGILNVPSPSFSHNPSPLPEDGWESKYPLPSAKDGEPLDLLPKSLYMNKAHGGHLCIYCGKLYSRKYGLKIHLRTHTGYKPLKCKVCQRPFGDPSNLNKHIRLHAEGETPYRCDQCGKVLVRRRDLERHIRSRHPNEADKITTHLDSPLSSDDGLNSSFEGESLEELDVVGLQQ